MQICDTDCYGKGHSEIYFDDKCVLHCNKNEYQKDKYSVLLSKFYDNFLNYTIEQIFDDNELLENKLTKEDVASYFKSKEFNNKEYNNIFHKTIFTPSCIHFPNRDSRDIFDYLKILNLFEQIHFNYCEFYISYLNLPNTECFFQDCHFHDRWTLYNYDVLENEDNVIYQTCIFYKTVSNYTPPEPKELAIYKYSQFDYSCQFKNSIQFNRVKFEDFLFNTNQYNYIETNIIKQLKFENCTFEKKFKLNNYIINEFICINSLFKNKFEFKENTINTFLINNSNFNYISDLYGCTFNKFNIKKSIFDNFSGFENCTFGTKNKLNEEIAMFKYSTFKDSLNLRNAKFLSGLDIKNINLQGESNFLDAEIESENTNRETFRTIKYSFDSIGNIIEANKYYQKEMQKREEELKNNLPKDFFDWLIFKIHDISSKHSQDWLLSLFWIIIITFIYSHFKIFVHQESLEYFILSFMLNIIVIILILFELILYKHIHIIQKALGLFMMYLIYSFITKDFNLEQFSNNINPFSIMTRDENLTFSVLIYKIILTYLIYQLIISIRQNTRRK